MMCPKSEYMPIFIKVLILAVFVISCGLCGCAPKDETGNEVPAPVSKVSESDVVSADALVTKDSAFASLRYFVPDLKVLSVDKTPLDGLYEVVAENQKTGRKGIVYLDSRGKYAIVGEIVDIKTKSSLTKARMEALQKIVFSAIPLEGSIVLGDENAKHKVVVFTDPD
jgi:thiol:disulfide interchange protein DsbC